MNRLLILLLSLWVCSLPAYAQTPEVQITLRITDGVHERELRFGLDPTATAGIDAALGEEKLPPMPPAGVFEARFTDANIGPLGISPGMYADYRPGTAAFAGAVEHELRFQSGTGEAIQLHWSLPKGVVVELEDVFEGVLLKQALRGAGNIRIPRGIQRALFTARYGVPNSAPAFTTTPVTEVALDQTYVYAISATDVDGDAFTLRAPTLPDWLTFAAGDPGQAMLSGTPPAAGIYPVEIEAADAEAEAVQAFNIVAFDASEIEPDLSLPVEVSNGIDTRTVYFGLDPEASLGIDPRLGEAVLPPRPPAALFDVRFIGEGPQALGNGTYRDYRPGSPDFVSTEQHILQIQRGAGSQIQLTWDLPEGVSVRLQSQQGDGIDQTVTRQAQITVIDPLISMLQMEVFYGAGNWRPEFTTAPVEHVIEGYRYTYRVGATDEEGSVTLRADLLPDDYRFTDLGDGEGLLAGPTLEPNAEGYPVILVVSDADGATREQRFHIQVLPRQATVESLFVIGLPAEQRVLRTGIHPGATDAIDAQLGERKLPPMPPAEQFEARFASGTVGNGMLDNGSYTDYRQGEADLVGQIVHGLRIQATDAQPLFWDLPSGVSATLRDRFGGSIVDESLQGQGQLDLPADQISTFELTMVYTGGNVAPQFTSSPVLQAAFDQPYTYRVEATDGNNDAITLSAQDLPAWLSFDDEGAGQGLLQGTPTAAEEGQHSVILHAEDDEERTTQTFTITVSDTPVLTSVVDVQAGWNLLGLSLNATDAAYESLFPQATTGTFFAFDGAYTIPDPAVFQLGTGYWLRFEAPEQVEVEGIAQNQVEVTLDEGWNIIAGPSCNVPATAVEDAESILLAGTLFGFRGSYQRADTIKTMQGYWVRAARAGMIQMDCAATQAVAKTARARLEDAEDTVRLHVRDTGTRASQTLYWKPSSEAVDARAYTLPPQGPGTAFRASFPGNRYMETVPQGATIQTSGVEGVVEVTIAGGHAPVYVLEAYAGTKKVGGYQVRSGEKARLPVGANKMYVSVPDTQSSSATLMHSSYPNPLDASATLQLDLPTQGTLTITVYDVLGRRVEVLAADQHFPMGRHRVPVDATAWPSGIYLYRIHMVDVSGKRTSASGRIQRIRGHQ